ncbi:MAG: peptidylprolyl isomerase [Burkholderiaceae bacterium]|jgi:peptidyl-prolyl cis-trans isomerase SurA|nr:peptidylprolyl isomerase [Burkholderiaceae bacterium]
MRTGVLAAALAALLPLAADAQSPRLRPQAGATPPAGSAPAAPAKDAAKAAPRSGAGLDRIVAVVNDEVITGNELGLRVRIAEQQLRRQNIALPPTEVLQRQVLERIIIDRAQVQLARETGVRVDDATVNATIARIAEQNRLELPQFRARLEADGVSFARFREDVRDDIAMTRLRDREVDSRIQVTEAEVENFLAEQAGVQTGSLEYNLAQILLRVPDNAATDRIEQIRKQAEDLAAQARSGADFARLAASFSAAPEALNGGELGWRSAERLPTLFLDAIKNLKPGQIAPIVRSPGGFHVLKLTGSRNAVESRVATGPLQQTRARHILLRVSDLTPEPEVKRRLAELRERATKGNQDFGSLARLHSVDPSSTRGGELGWLYAGDTVPEFERAMDALKPGEISEPVQSPFGWHLIQVLERRTDESPIERNRLAARQALRERKSDEAYQEWVRQLRDKTYVEMRLEDA